MAYPKAVLNLPEEDRLALARHLGIDYTDYKALGLTPPAQVGYFRVHLMVLDSDAGISLAEEGNYIYLQGARKRDLLRQVAAALKGSNFSLMNDLTDVTVRPANKGQKAFADRPAAKKVPAKKAAKRVVKKTTARKSARRKSARGFDAR